MSHRMMLRVENLSVAYDGIAAVRGVSLNVAAGEMVALIGPNGAGKTTLLNALSGVLRPAAGQVIFDAVDITRWRAHRVARSGLLQVPEGRRILDVLSVDENLALGSLALGARGKESPQDLANVHALFPRLAERREQGAGSLSGGEQQMLAIGRALMGRPRLLLLDEPSLGLAPILVDQVFTALERLREQGLTILLVEQNARRALASADRAYVMEAGLIVLAGAASDLARDPRIEAHYLGQSTDPDRARSEEKVHSSRRNQPDSDASIC